MIPIVTPVQMAAIDAAAPEPVEVLIGRAGAAVARAALAMLRDDGGTYGRRVLVVAGKGNNGNDGRAAAARLRRRGVRCLVLDALDVPATLPPVDLVIDAAFGTGFRGAWNPPAVPERRDGCGGPAPVLAVDIPSGVDGLTGQLGGEVWSATRTVSFAALKPGLVLEPGASYAGAVEVVDIGLDTSSAECWFVEDHDVAHWIPQRAPDTHKWKAAVWVVGGSSGMEGAATLTASAALRAGAGYVRVSAPGSVPSPRPVECVGTALPTVGWGDEVVGSAQRFGAVVVGNGLGLESRHADELRTLVGRCPVPCVVDADALTLLSAEVPGGAGPWSASTVITPHDGEYERLAGRKPGPDRFAAAQDLAAALGCVVLLKGPCTIVASPDGTTYASRTGDARLATLGTGDVLAGVVGALCSRGLAPDEAAAAGAVVHGLAGSLGWSDGLVAGDLPELVPAVLDRLASLL